MSKTSTPSDTMGCRGMFIEPSCVHLSTSYPMNILKRKNSTGDKIMFYYDLGRGAGQRPSTGIFVYVNPKDQTKKNHNKQALALLEIKKSQLTIEQQAIGSAFIPLHKFKANFLEYYEEYVKLNRRNGNRHLSNSLTQFKLFIKTDFIAPIDINENFCKRFRQFLLDKFTGETPGGYYARFKWAVNAATADGYFHKNPTENVSAKSNTSVRIKENLEVEEYLMLLNAPCLNEEIKAAFIFSCYTGLRWVDVKKLEWKDINRGVLTTRIIQKKTGKPVSLTLHTIAKDILEKQKFKAQSCKNPDKIVFYLPTPDGANKVLNHWVRTAGIDKYITWSCARLKMAREGLSFELRNILHHAKTRNTPVKKECIALQLNGKHQHVTIEAIPILDAAEPHFLVLFQDRTTYSTVAEVTGSEENGTGEKKHSLKYRIQQLEKELAQSRQDLRSITEDQQAANEELQSANEELLSGSEELPAVNEELETGKEKLQSTNEELTSLNHELYDRKAQLNILQKYSEGVFATIRDPLITLTHEFKIIKATEGFYKI